MGATLVRDIGVRVRIGALPAELMAPRSMLEIRGLRPRSARLMEIRRVRSDLELPAVELRLEKAGKG